jgi:hypothetical protein
VTVPCTHAAATVVVNAALEPVRLRCPCGREWRVVPAELDLAAAAARVAAIHTLADFDQRRAQIADQYAAICAQTPAQPATEPGAP